MSDSLFDEQKIATELAQRAIDRILSGGEKLLRAYWAKYSHRDLKCYGEYLHKKRSGAELVRNITYDSSSVRFEDIYVETWLERSNYPRFKDTEFVTYLLRPPDGGTRDTHAVVVTGPAGCGKSLLMRYVFFQLQIRARLPVLIVARTFNRLRVSDLETRIHDDFEAVGVNVMKEQLVAGLQSGLFVILIDGWDELKPIIQAHYETALLEFTTKYPKCSVIVSSRPTESIRGWQVFKEMPIAPMRIPQIESLVQSLTFDLSVKQRFVALVKNELYSSHREFVSRPLLCIIMLLTYSDSGHISNRRYEFFEDAFTALWSKHDARKEGYERPKHTGLDKGDFLRLLSSFAASSYIESDYNMRESQFRKHFGTAKALSGANCKEDEFRKDLVISTSLFVEDGPYLRFSHRAFHEYFTSPFICGAADDVCVRIIDEISDRIETDAVLPLVKSISPSKIEANWTVPKLEEVIDAISKVENDGDAYADLGVKQYDQGIRLSKVMNGIRILYDLEPNMNVLKAAYFAALDMKVPVRALSGSSHGNNPFDKDFRNFVNLSKDLKAKRDRRGNALLNLIPPPG
jgi:hypothetical protein